MIGESPADIPSNLVPYILQVAMGKLEKLMVFGGITLQRMEPVFVIIYM